MSLNTISIEQLLQTPVCMMTGEPVSSAAASTAMTISMFSTLNAPTAYPLFCASSSNSFDVTSIVLSS